MNNHNFQTEIEFELPKGYLDESGELHKRGTMRLATAADEILPLRDPRVQQNEAYLAVIVLARVITRLGSLGAEEAAGPLPATRTRERFSARARRLRSIDATSFSCWVDLTRASFATAKT